MCQSCGMHIRGSKHCDLAHLDVQMLKLRTPKPPTQWCRPYRPPVPNLLPALPRPACPVPTLPRYIRYIRRLVPTPPATADIRHRQRIRACRRSTALGEVGASAPLSAAEQSPKPTAPAGHAAASGYSCSQARLEAYAHSRRAHAMPLPHRRSPLHADAAHTEDAKGGEDRRVGCRGGALQDDSQPGEQRSATRRHAVSPLELLVRTARRSPYPPPTPDALPTRAHRSSRAIALWRGIHRLLSP